MADAEPADPARADETDELDRLRRALEAERAGAEHWRDVARRREAALTDLKARTPVRAVLAVERRSAPARARLRRGLDAVRRGAAATAVTAAALPVSLDRSNRARTLDQALATADRAAEPARDDRPVLVVLTGRGPRPAWCDELATAAGVRVEHAPDLGGAAQLAAAATEPLVGFVATTTEPLTSRWLQRLADAVTGDVVAASAVLVHPRRRARRATPHDLLVRSAGLDVVLDAAGCPRIRARSAGGDLVEAVRAGDPSGSSPPLLGAGAVVVDRHALERCGGLRPATGDDAAMVDLSLRLRGNGGRLACARDVVAFDHRPVARAADLVGPLQPGGADEAGWADLLADHGPALRRSAPGADTPALLIAITVAAPSAKVADRWGDWHLAEGLARALERQGQHVHVQTLADAEAPRSRVADVHLVLRGLARVPRVAGQRHGLWIISHPEDLDDVELEAADVLFVASEPFARALRLRTTTPVEVLLQATDPERFAPRAPAPEHRHDVTVVGKSRDVLRPMVRDAVAAGLRPAIYGSGWDDLVDPSLVVTDHVDNHDLPAVYSSAGVVLNDHWDTMRRWGFVSNRVFDVVACGTPLVTDEMPEVTAIFGDLVPTWHDPDELATVVADLLADPRAARERVAAARAIVVADHTFDRRAEVVLATLSPHDPSDGPPGPPAPS